jgi:DNA-binding transcriptional LysR family regulator
MTRAAGELGITQQAVSRRISRLESQLGRTLVARGTRSSGLTNDGAAVLTIARPALAAATEMEVALGELFAAPDILSVAASLTVADHFLPRWIHAFVNNGNDARLLRTRSTNTREVIRLVSDSSVDVGFVEGDEPPRGLAYTRLATDELAVYVSPDHPWAIPGHVSPWTLAHTPLVTREEGSGCRAVLRSALLQRGVNNAELAAPALELTSNTAVLESAAANVAPAVISTRAATPFVRSGALTQVRVDHTPLHRQLGMIWKQGDKPSTHAARELLRAASMSQRQIRGNVHGQLSQH